MDQKGSTNIQVAIRIRPLIPTEKENKLKPQWATQDNIIYQIDDSGQQFGELYSFDHIFDMNKTNTEIYNDIVKDFVISSLDGLNSTIFAYGQTSSGKTYTMLGDKKDTGIMSQAIENIFSSIESNSCRKFLIRVSYIEIYNEKINDLLDPNNKDVKIREFFPCTIGLQNIKEELVSTRDQMYDCLKKGNLNRRIGSTKANDRSSRSHTIFKIMIESTLVEDGGSSGFVQISNLNLVDLAGSERVAQTKATGMRLKEGGHINKSLSALGLVIKQLSDGQEFVNFRDSKLTRLLQDSLGGNSKTLIIATITVASTEDTSSTLAFAQRAKTVKNKPRVNEILTDADVSKRYAALNTKLQQKLEEQLLINQRLQRTQEANVREMTRLQQQMELLEDFQHGTKTPKKTIPKRRHTIGISAHKRLFQKGRISLEEFDDKSSDYSEEIAVFENLITKNSRDSFNVGTAATVSCMETIIEEESITSNKKTTPEDFLRKRLSALEQDYNELVTFTRDEENIFNETAQKADELEKKIIQVQNELEVERDFKNRFKVREDELCSRIRELEEEIKTKTVSQPVLNSSECTQIMDQLICLQDILNNPDFINDSVQVKENSVLQVIEKFNNKLKTSKDIIENEILKQINNFDHGSQISLPNDLQSFNDLLNELSWFESDIPVDLINNMKKESIEHFKILIKVYESLLRKNEFIKICSDRMKSLEKNAALNECEKEDLLKQIKQKNMDKSKLLEEVENFKRMIDNCNTTIGEKSQIISEAKQEIDNLNVVKEKLNLDYNNLQQQKDYEIQNLQKKIENLTIELEEFSDNLMEKDSIIDSLKDNKELINLKNTIEQLNTEVKNKEKIIDNCQAENEKLKEKLLAAESLKTVLKSELEKLQQTLKSTKDKIRSDIENELRVFKADLKNSKEIVNKILSQNKSLKCELDLKVGELTELRNSFDKLSLEIIEKDKVIVNLRDANQNLEKELESVASDNDSLRFDLQKVEDVCKSYSQKIDLLNSQVTEKVTSLDKLQKLCSDLKQNLDSAKRDSSGCLSEKESIKIEFDRLASEIQEKNYIINKTEKNLENSKRELEKSQQYSRELKLQKDSLQSQLEELKNVNMENLKKESEKIVQENKSLKTKLDAFSLDLIEKDKVIYEYQNHNTKLKLQVENLSKHSNKLKSDVKNLQDELNQINFQLKTKCDSEESLQQEILVLKQNLVDVKSDLSRSSVNDQEIQKWTSSINERDQRLNQTELKMQRLKQLLNNAQTENVELKQSLKEKEKLKSELSSYKMQLLLTKTKLEEHIKINEKLSLQMKDFGKIKDFTQESDLSGINEFEGFLCSVIEQYLNDQKMILSRRHSQNERDCFKNILKDLKLSNTVLKNQLNLLRTQKSFDLTEINQQLLKTRGNFKEYCEAEKSLLQKQIDQLEINNKAYLDEIIVLKNSRAIQNSTNCSNCESLQIELSRLNKLTSLQEETLNSLRNKNATLGKENVDRIKQIANLQVQIYSEQDRKAEVQYSDYLKFYRENDKIQQKQIQMLQEKVENYRNKTMRDKHSIKVQCDLLPEDSVQHEKYNSMKQVCLARKQEIASLKSENSQLKSALHNNMETKQSLPSHTVNVCSAEVQCDILDVEKYNLTKRVCRLRNEEIAALKTELKALKMTK